MYKQGGYKRKEKYRRINKYDNDNVDGNERHNYAVRFTSVTIIIACIKVHILNSLQYSGSQMFPFVQASWCREGNI